MQIYKKMINKRIFHIFFIEFINFAVKIKINYESNKFWILLVGYLGVG